MNRRQLSIVLAVVHILTFTLLADLRTVQASVVSVSSNENQRDGSIDPREPNDIELIKAIESRNLQKVKYWLGFGANPNCRQWREYGIIWCGLRPSDGRELINDSEYTAVMMASANGDDRIVQLLVAKGARVNDRRTLGGATPLMLAADGGHPRTVKLLLS